MFLTACPPINLYAQQGLHTSDLQMTKLTLTGFAAQPSSKLAARKRVLNVQQRVQINKSFYYLYGSVHHNIFYEITNRCSYMHSILFHCKVHSTCCGCFTHPSSGVQFITVSTATGTNHSIVSATYSQCGLRPHWE